jgi:hypothetical protein
MQQIIVPIALFACITYAFKAIVDARMRYLLLRSGGSEELVRSILLGEEQQRRLASLRWGIVLIAVAVGFGLIEAFHWYDITPGVIAVLAAVTGLGNLAVFAISRRLG